MNFLKKNLNGILVCFVIAVPSWLLGKTFPVVGGPVIAILAGMLITLVWTNKGKAESGIKWTSKIILQTAVVLLGFGMNLGVILQTGKQSLPIIVCTISTSLIIAWLLRKIIKVPSNTSILVGVGAAVLFPVLGSALGFDTTGGGSFGLFAGTAINDTSSVTAAASTWDSMWNLGSETLNTAVTVKLTRTLAIIPITLVLSLIRARSASKAGTADSSANKFSLKRAFPMFILYFIIAAIITTVCMSMGVSADVFAPLKELSKFFIIMAMAAIGLNSNVVKLIKSGGKPLLLGACCWVGITIVSLGMQHVMGIW